MKPLLNCQECSKTVITSFDGRCWNCHDEIFGNPSHQFYNDLVVVDDELWEDSLWLDNIHVIAGCVLIREEA